jgi:hypothetical protein
MAEITCSTRQAESILMPVACCTITVNFMIMVSGIIIGVMVGLCMAGLADCIPGRVVFTKGKVGWILENNRI